MRTFTTAVLLSAIAVAAQAQDICNSGLPVADGVCSNGGEIPGVAGIDYPVFAQVPTTNFRCDNIGIPGYYADPGSGCQAFYICGKQGKGTGFLCPNGTLFNQEVLVCDWWTHVDCNKAPSLYGINQQILAEMNAANERLGVNQRERERLAAAGINPNSNPFDLQNPFNRNPNNPFDLRNPYNPVANGQFSSRNPYDQVNSNRPFGQSFDSRFPNPGAPVNNFAPTPAGALNSRFPNAGAPFNNFGPTPTGLPDSRFPNPGSSFNNFGTTPAGIPNSRFPTPSTPFNNFGPTPAGLPDSRFQNPNRFATTPTSSPFAPTAGTGQDSRFPNSSPFPPTVGSGQDSRFPNPSPFGATPSSVQNSRFPSSNPYRPTAGLASDSQPPNSNNPYNSIAGNIAQNQQISNPLPTPFGNSPFIQNPFNETSFGISNNPAVPLGPGSFATTGQSNGPYSPTPSPYGGQTSAIPNLGITTTRPDISRPSTYGPNPTNSPYGLNDESGVSPSSTPFPPSRPGSNSGYSYPKPSTPYEVDRPDREYLPPF